jgi:hypothetical protein
MQGDFIHIRLQKGKCKKVVRTMMGEKETVSGQKASLVMMLMAIHHHLHRYRAEGSSN